VCKLPWDGWRVLYTLVILSAAKDQRVKNHTATVTEVSVRVTGR